MEWKSVIGKGEPAMGIDIKIVQENQFNNLRELYKKWAEAGVSASTVQTNYRHVLQMLYF